MRNTQHFDLNIYDEQREVSNDPNEDWEAKNPFFIKSLTSEQKKVLQSPYLQKIGLAKYKWQEVIDKKNDELHESFTKVIGGEFETYGSRFQPFKSGKFWQVMGYIDGTNFSEKHNISREEYQNNIIAEVFSGNRFNPELLQTSWDLAINSALLSDVMPEARNNGSIYLFNNIIEDNNSLFYPSVTNNFQKRIVNETFWQSLLNPPQGDYLGNLETILTKYRGELDPKLADDNILRWSQYRDGLDEINSINPLVIGRAGPESFTGLSKKAIENYGLFIEKVFEKSRPSSIGLTSLVNNYIDAINCVDDDGMEYFELDEKEKLLKLHCVENVKN